jgi:phospholipase C
MPARGSPIQHVVIVLQENRTFENIFHGFPGAHTVDFGYDHNGNKVVLAAVHLMTPYDPAHTLASWLGEYDKGAMNGFDAEKLDYGSVAPADFAYAYAMQSDVRPYWDLAKEGSLADAFFADHRSASFAGHQFPIAGASGPVSPSLPDYYASGNPSGGETCDDPGTGKAINLKTGSEDETYSSCFDYQTIADLLTAKGKTWRFYIGAGAATARYVSSFAVIKHIRQDPSQWSNVVSPATKVLSDAAAGTLADVSWVVGSFVNSDHAGQTVPSSNGPNWVASVFNGIGNSRSWGSTLIILTYDDWGGWYDEMAPRQQFSAFEPGFRVPFVAVSPYSRRGYVSHQTHYMGSILHYLESNFGLGSLGTSDARSDDLGDLFDYKQSPLRYVPVKPLPSAAQASANGDAVPPGLDPD